MPASDRPLLRLVHYWWPLVVGWSAIVVIQRATMRAPDPAGVGMLLCGILAAYSLDRLREPRRPDTAGWLRDTLLLVFGLAAAGGALLLPHLPLHTAAIVPLMGMVSFTYAALKRIPAAKNFFVPLVWTWSAIALPFPDGSWAGWRWVAEPIAMPLFLLFAAGVLLCDLKDETRDRHRGEPSLAVLYGGRTAAWLGAALAFAAAVMATVDQRPGVAVAAAGLGATALRPQLLATDLVGPLVVDVMLSLPGFLIAARLV